MAKPNLSKIEEKMKKGGNFELTDAQYEKLTGTSMPKDKYYLKNRSAIAQQSAKNNYQMEIIEKKIIFKKIR